MPWCDCLHGDLPPQERGAEAAHTQRAVVSPPGECQFLTSGGTGDNSDDEDDVLRGAEAECYSRVSVWFWTPFCLALCPQLLVACLGWQWWQWWWLSVPHSKLGLSLFSFSEMSPSHSLCGNNQVSKNTDICPMEKRPSPDIQEDPN